MESPELLQLIDAINDCDLETVRELVNDETRFACNIFGDSVISFATTTIEQLEILRFLLDTDRVSELISDAVIGCIRNDNFEAMKVAFEIAAKYGVDLKHPVFCGPADTNVTPLEAAICYGRLEIIEWLLFNGANVNTQITYPSGKTISLLELAETRIYTPEIANLLKSWRRQNEMITNFSNE